MLKENSHIPESQKQKTHKKYNEKLKVPDTNIKKGTRHNAAETKENIVTTQFIRVSRKLYCNGMDIFTNKIY